MNAAPQDPHPTPEQWISFLYGELPPDGQASCRRHLDQCAACRQQVEEWRGTMSTLDAWKLPARRPSARVAPTLLRWAAAAAVLLGVGLIGGRLTAPRADLDQFRAELQRQFRADLQTATVAMQADSDRKLEDLAQAWATARAQDQQTTVALYQRAETQRKSDLVWLRRDVETLALNAEARLDSTQQNLNQLAAASQSLRDPTSPATPRP